MIEVIEDVTIYDNPRPQVHSRHGIFPGLVELPGGELLNLFVLGEAFESPNSTTHISRSRDGGRSWTLQGPLYDKSVDPVVTSDCLKATRLGDGRLIAVGYCFYRHDPEQGISIEETGGILPGDDIVSFSEDDGRTWTVPRVIPRSHPELLEISGPCIQTAAGDLLAVAGIFKMPDGSNPSGQYGVLFRSRDGGETWDDRGRFFDLPGREVTAWESRICEMQPGRVVAITWAYDFPAARHLPNYVAISRDNGHTWLDPINTGHQAQASNLMWLGDDLLLTIHCHREGDIGVCVRIVDLAGDRWKILEEKFIWNAAQSLATDSGQVIHDMFQSLRFGQASLVPLQDGTILAAYWTIEDGQGRVKAHRLKVSA